MKHNLNFKRFQYRYSNKKMIHQEVTTDWVYEHYLIYLYLSIADSDCIISNEELNEIRCKAMTALDENRCSVLISEVYKEFRSHTDEEKRDYIKSNSSRYLRTQSIRDRVISALESNIHDTDEESTEMIMFRFIRKVINLSSH